MARPAEYEREDVINKAMEVFWRTGYTATSVSDLVNATDLKPGSIYAAFSSKRGLFLEVVDTYANRSQQRIKDCLASSDSPLEGITAFFHRMGKEIACDDSGKGCLLVNSLLELSNEDDEIHQKVSEYLGKVEERLYLSLKKAVNCGELEPDTNCEALSKSLMASIWGLRVLSTTRPAPTVYSDIINYQLASLPRRKIL